jgi:hypothetical protein
MALTQATKEAIWLRRLLEELKLPSTTPTLILEDNQSAISLAKNPVNHARTKHIDIQYHYIREAIEDRQIELKYTPTDEMIADLMTKALPKPRFEQYVKKLNLMTTRKEDESNAS